jgi:hypothetical protein
LKNLPADYDVKLYKGSTLVGTSANSGLTNETITYNTTTTGSYKVYVYGYNGAFNATQCYTLRASTSGVNFREMESIEALDGGDVVSAQLEIQNVFPNPTEDKIQIQFYQADEEEVQIEVWSLMGQLLIRQNWNAFAGNNGLALDLKDLAAGNYVLAVRSNHAVDTQLIQKN